jgi:glycosyltransferase involved in cell wall biosynthesis
MDHPLIARVITRMNVGGPARHVLALTEGLDSRFPADLFVGTPEPDESEIHLQGVTVIRVPLRRKISPADDMRTVRHLRRKLRDYPLIDSHMSKAGALARLAVRGRNPRPATVHTFHGHVLDGYFGPLTSRAFVEIERTLARWTDALVAVSPEIRDQLLGLGIGRPEQWHVVPLGFDLEPFATGGTASGTVREALSLSRDVPLIGIFGRLAPIKGHDFAIRVLRLVPDAHLVIFGDGGERLTLEAQIRGMGLEDRVHLAGWWEDVPSAMKAMDVVLNTSVQEGTPVALIEAAAAGKPLVAVDVGGVRDVVRDGETGILVPRDEQEVARALRRLLDDGSARIRMGASGQRDVLERFAKEKMLRATGAIYERLLSGR